MNRIETSFADRVGKGEKILAPFVCGGCPAPGVLSQTLPALESAGAGLVEVGVPFSDPIADGPVIAGAMHRALEAGMTPQQVLDEIEEARSNGCEVPVALMASVSMMHRAGVGEFADRMKAAGVDGVILPDCPLGEAQTFSGPIRERGLSVSLLVAPTSPEERAGQIASACTGFVYVLARTGITGDIAGEQAPADHLAARVEYLRTATEVPLACGFGVADAAGVARVVQEAGADAAIVGTALVRRMEDAGPRDAAKAAAEFCTALAGGLAESV